MGYYMRVLIGVMKDRPGTYYATKKVPKALREAVPRVLNNGRRQQTWIRRSLGTKSANDANRRAKAVPIDIDRTLEQAAALLIQRPLRDTLSDTEIKRIADHHYAAAAHRR